MTQLTGRPLRADAERNRRRILEAAGRLLARDGLEASFDDIAREAGVGVGTVYRRFPAREQLLQALFEDRLESILAALDRASLATEAIEGLRTFVEVLIEHQVADRGLKELVFSQAECAERMMGTKARLIPVLEALVERARREGGLRPDVGLADVMLSMFMVATSGALTADLEPQQWRRQFELTWSGLCASSDRSVALPGEPMSNEQLDVAFNQGQP